MGWMRSERLRREYGENVLHEGVPDWLWSGIIPWVEKQLSDYQGVTAGNLSAVERTLRRPLNWRYRESSAWESLVEHMRADHEYAIDLLSLLVAVASGDWTKRDELERLAHVLTTAGSAWHVRITEDGAALERRVEAEQVERFEAAAGEGRSGEHLRAAWAAMYGRGGNASTAYREAVKAVEAAGAPVFTPNDRDATLGKMIAAFRDKPEKWAVPLGSTPEQGREAVLQMMKGVWHGQHDRHGSPDEERPTSVSPEEAEAALHTAITLVHLLKSGLISTV